MYRQALELAIKAQNPRLEATTLNSLAVLQEMNGYIDKSRKQISYNICKTVFYFFAT